MTPPENLRALLAEPGFIVMPAVWDGLTAKLAAGAGFKTAFLSGSCVAARRFLPGGACSNPSCTLQASPPAHPRAAGSGWGNSV